MTEFVKIYGEEHEIATEQELLEFVNKGRKAGGADILDALLPSRPSDPNACLIANGLNFGCFVDSVESFSESGKLPGDPWFMYLPGNVLLDQAQEIADALGCELNTNARRLHGEATSQFAVRLPNHIRDAAIAFDEGVAFKNFNTRIVGEPDVV